MHPQVADDLLQTILAQIAIAAVQLQGLVGDLKAGVGDVANVVVAGRKCAR